MLFADWSDADTVNALLGAGGLAGVVTAVGVIIVRYTRQRGVNKTADGKQDIERRAQDNDYDFTEMGKVFEEMRGLLKLQEAQLKGQLKSCDRRNGALEADVKALREDVAVCRTDRERLAEQIRWMKRILRDKGWVSDEDEARFPRTQSDQIDTRDGGNE